MEYIKLNLLLMFGSKLLLLNGKMKNLIDIYESKFNTDFVDGKIDSIWNLNLIENKIWIPNVFLTEAYQNIESYWNWRAIIEICRIQLQLERAVTSEKVEMTEIISTEFQFYLFFSTILWLLMNFVYDQKINLQYTVDQIKLINRRVAIKFLMNTVNFKFWYSK